MQRWPVMLRSLRIVRGRYSLAMTLGGVQNPLLKKGARGYDSKTLSDWKSLWGEALEEILLSG